MGKNYIDVIDEVLCVKICLFSRFRVKKVYFSKSLKIILKN